MDTRLSELEMKIIRLVAQGLKNKEIAKVLYLAEGTIRNYITRIFNKTDLNNRSQIVAYYYEHYKNSRG